MNKVQFEIRSKGNAKKFKSEKPWAAISISTKSDDFPELHTENRKGLLQLSFWDISNPKWLEIKDDDSSLVRCLKVKEVTDKLFKPEQAQQILDFTAEMWPQIDVMLVHCEMGLCRSPGIAAALEHIYHGAGSENDYFNRFTPNNLVFQEILRVHYGKSIGQMIAEKFEKDNSST